MIDGVDKLCMFDPSQKRFKRNPGDIGELRDVRVESQAVSFKTVDWEISAHRPNTHLSAKGTNIRYLQSYQWRKKPCRNFEMLLATL